MARVNIVNPQTATGPAKIWLDTVQAQLGVTPNFIRVLAIQCHFVVAQASVTPDRGMR